MVLVVSFSILMAELDGKGYYFCKLISAVFQLNKQGKTLQLRPIERVERGPTTAGKVVQGTKPKCSMYVVFIDLKHE